MLGNGLQGSLLGVRAGLEGFGNGVTGAVMACFFIGFLTGSSWTPHVVRRVGHIRVFAALAAMASTSILLHPLFLDPWVWGAMRFVTGLCYAGIYVVAESWLNSFTNNDTRGQFLALYMFISFAGMGFGQLLLNLSDASGVDLFILASILISFAVVPMLLSATPAPGIEYNKPVGLRKLFGICPLGVTGMFVAGLINGSIFGMGAVYAHGSGLSIAEVAWFMGALIVGAAVLQLPIGKLSDMFDRRTVMTCNTFLAAVAALLVEYGPGDGRLWFYVATALFGGLGLSIHSLCLAYTNDFLEADEVLGASSEMVLILGAGSIVGPLAVGLLMDLFGPPMFFLWVMAVLTLFGLFAIWRMRHYAAPPMEEQGPYVAVPVQASTFDIAAEQSTVDADETDAAAHPPSGQ